MLSPKQNETVWGAKPKYVEYHGETVEVFTRKAVALALNRQIVTIRALEKQGILAHPKLQNGRGHWLYTRQQIRDLVELAMQEKVLDPGPRNPWTDRFAREARRIIRRLPQ